MEAVMKHREIFFNNLLILGFDKASIEKEYRTTCDKNMFSVPNQKMFEVVTYFLFSKLNQVSNPKYAIPWPLMDKKQHREFQKSCFNHLSNIAQGSNVKFPRVVSSLLSTFGGDRFYDLLLAFSTHVVQKTISKKDNVSLIMMPTVSHRNKQDIIDTLKIATILSVENFQEIQSFSLNHFKLLVQCARQYVAQIQYLKQSLTTNHSLLEENKSTMKELYDNTQSEKITWTTIVKNSLEYEKKVKNLWLGFEKFFTKESKLWSCLCSEIEGKNDKYSLDGADFPYHISDNMKKYCPELNQVDGIRTGENEKLDLFKYLKTFCILLEFYMKTTIKGEMLEVSELCVIKNTSRLEESLKHIQSLNENLVTNILPSIKDSTEKLEANSLMKFFSDDLETFVKECPSWSCCSKQFQENTSSFRNEKVSAAPYTDDAYDSSLLFKDDSTHCSEDFSKRHRFYATAGTSAVQSYMHSTNSVPLSEIHPSNTLFTNETLNNMERNFKPENSFKPNHSFGLNVADSYFKEELTQNLVPDTSTMQIHHPQPFSPSDEDFVVDIQYSKPFKMRESWQKEDSLNAMTLEDVSVHELE